jgi:hypothetical protein
MPLALIFSILFAMNNEAMNHSALALSADSLISINITAWLH